LLARAVEAISNAGSAVRSAAVDSLVIGRPSLRGHSQEARESHCHS
jgi:hypothetical protein